MIAHDYHATGMSLINMSIQRLVMPWRDEENKVDSGVFAMRHMETYMGHRVKYWDNGLAENSDKTLQVLRVKYCKVLLSCDANNLSKENMSHVEACLKGFRHVNFNKFLDVLKRNKD